MLEASDHPRSLYFLSQHCATFPVLSCVFFTWIVLDCVRRIIEVVIHAYAGVLGVVWNFDQFSVYNLEELNCQHHSHLVKTSSH